ncbi:MAG: hypothetical protein IPP08_03360 [Chlorobiota bacterium]|jgi:hypothetical protein|nr:MAG: hypothetical protein IPP08_03360 [Chlorobiota bacterium]
MKSIIVLLLMGVCSTALAQTPHNWRKVMDFEDTHTADIKSGEILDTLNAVTIVKVSYEDSVKGFYSREGLKRSTDRGRTWEWVWYKFKFEPVCLSYPSKNTIVVGGSNRFVGVSNDSGQSWREFQFPKEFGSNRYDVWDISMFDDKNGLINLTELEYFGFSYIYKTDDGWQTYSKVSLPKGYYYFNPLGGRYPYMQALSKTNYFVKLGIVFDTINKQVFGKTTDAGSTWKIITEDEIFYERSDTIQGVSFDFADSLNGWALGNMRYKGDNVPWCMLSKNHRWWLNLEES